MYKHFKDEFKNTTDGTYNILTDEPVKFDSGYQVSFERPDDEYSEMVYDSIVKSLSAVLGSHVYIGVWEGQKEVSFHTEDLYLARMIGYAWNQDAIWDWKLLEAITLK